MTMITMAAVHEQMHQGAGQDQQKRQGAEDMCPVLGQQKKCRDRAQHQQANAIARAPQALGFMRVVGYLRFMVGSCAVGYSDRYRVPQHPSCFGVIYPASPGLELEGRQEPVGPCTHLAPASPGVGGMRCIIMSIMFCIMSMRISII